MNTHIQKIKKLFDLNDRVIVITGGAGMLGKEHAEAVAEFGGIPVLLDINGDKARDVAGRIRKTFGRVDGLINNAANDQKMKIGSSSKNTPSFGNFPIRRWEDDLAVGLTGAFICSQIFGNEMVRRGKGVILNIASDLSVIAPDQRIYRTKGLYDDAQPTKPATYSVLKHGLVGLTKYLASFWGKDGIRVNAISPGGVFSGQSKELVNKITKLIPLGRMARADEYKGAVVFLLSDSSGYITGANIIIDGGRTCV